MKILRVIFVLSGILTLISIFGISTIFYLTSNSLPKYQNQLFSTTIKSNITISRDNFAIPFIEAKNELDSFFALGYVHAQDRLWQMILLRRTVQGRLSEIIGSSGLENDTLMRTLGIYNTAKNSEKNQTPEILALLESYSAGINFYIKQISENSLGRGSPEFFIFTSEIAPWRPADTIALLKLVALQSTNKAEVEVLRTQVLLAQVKPNRYNDLFFEPPFISSSQNKTISYIKAHETSVATNIPYGITQKKLSYPADYLNFGSGLSASNIFAVMPHRSATGSVLAASDPHAILTAPSNFMLINIELSTGVVVGGTIPGIPALLIGRSKNIGWGVSNAYIDDQDLFIEKLNPKNKSEYFTENGPTKFKISSEIIKIKDEKSITLEIRSTKNGPVLPPNVLEIDSIRPKDHEISMSWTGLSSDDRSIESLISIMKSQTIKEAKKNLPLLKAPGQNIMLIDSKNIEIITAGTIPKRDISHSTKGTIPSLGWRNANSWLGAIPFNSHPKVRNPSSGIILNTNNKTTNAIFPHHVSFDWGDSQRIIRATNLLSKRQFHTVESFKEIQTDTVSISARILLPLLAKNLWFDQQASQNSRFKDTERNALKILSEWNGNMNQNNPEPLIFVSWLREFQRMIMIDNLGELYKKFAAIKPLFLERVLRDKNGAAEWCDIMQTASKESCEQIATRSLIVAIEKLQKRFGPTIDDWRWGDPHFSIHKAKIIGSWPLLSFFTNIVHEVSGGDNTIMMSKMLNPGSNQYMSRYGSTLRTIFDFSNETYSLFVISTGQSGHFLSPHYDDQSLIWQKDEYIRIPYDLMHKKGSYIVTTTIKPIQDLS